MLIKDFVDDYPLPFVILSPVIKNGSVDNFIFKYANKAAAESNNLHQAEFVGNLLLDIHPHHKSNGIFSGLRHVYLSGERWHKSIEYNGPSGSSSISGFFTIHASKKDDYVIVGWSEFTDIKLAEKSLRKTSEELQQSLLAKEQLVKEKELLIKESHHRIKNNLQLITSMMRLQLNEKEIPDSDFFKTIESKIYSISLLHEHLYHKTNISTVNLGIYLSDLTRHLLSANDTVLNNLEINYDDIEIETDRAVSIGLIVNELITNSLKYAFVKNTGIIEINIKDKGDFFMLVVRDNGRGLPEGISLSESKTLGIQLVNMMSSQLSDEFSLTSENGTLYQIKVLK
jgi:two-component sensor histidine kinase